MKIIANIAKRDSKQQLVLVEVYIPNDIDSQGEFVSPETLEKAAHDFSAGGNHNNVSVMHNGQRIDASVVESYIAKKGDPLFAEGTWAAVIKIRDPVIWEAIEKGVLRGVSFEGKGHTREATINGKTAKEIYSLDIHTISIVDRPSTKREFKMTKRDNSIEAMATTLTAIAGTIASISNRLDKQDAMIDAIAKGQPVSKSLVNPNADAITRQLRKGERLQERLENVWADPSQYPETDEADIRRRIEKAEDKLYELGHNAVDPATMESSSGFAFRGGRSDFLQASPSTFDDILGVSKQTQELRKSEDEISLNCLIL